MEIHTLKDDHPAFTVAICTRDRARSLERALRSICDCDKPELPWELIVVDNGSSDATFEVAAEFRGALPITVHRENRVGLSNARNAAVERGGGAHIIWLDDDVVVGRAWLCAYAEAFARWPEAAFFGGAIHPLFDPEPRRWLLRGLAPVASAYALRGEPQGWVAIDRTTGELPFGANMAFRMTDQRRHPFDARLGRGAAGPALGEETAVMRRILDEGGFGVWVPDADIRHVIGRERQTTGYLWDYYRAVGALKSATDGERPLARRTRLKGWLKCAKSLLRYARGRLLADPETWTSGLKGAATAVGELYGDRRPDYLIANRPRRRP